MSFGALGYCEFDGGSWVLASMVLLLMLCCVGAVVVVFELVFLRPAPSMSLNIFRCVRSMSVSMLFVETHAGQP